MALLLSFWFYDLLALVAAVVATTYVYFNYRYQHWQKRGFPTCHEPSFPFGHFAGVNRVKSMSQMAADIYKRAPNQRFVGCYFFHNPIMIIRDLEVTKNILVKNFTHFQNRGFELNLEKDPLAGHLFSMKGQEWRNLRVKLTPTFTTGKMRMMFPILLDVAKHLEEIFEKSTEQDETEVKDILSRFTIDVISSVAFGIETNSLKNPDCEFRKLGLQILQVNIKQLILSVLFFAFPWVFKKLPFSFTPKNLSDSFIGIVQETMDYRQKNNIHRNDFMQLLLQLKTLGYVQDADNPQKANTDEEKQQKFTIEQAAAQAFLFFLAGFETTSSTMQFALYELALNPDLQTRAQEEVDRILEKYATEKQLSYDALMQMELLDRIVNETLRKYPVTSTLFRKCEKEYSIPGTDLKFEPGDTIWFSVYGYHHDPEYYPDPEKFDPDRFLPEVKEARPHYAYLPFGEGPRSCIANRFGLMQTKAVLALTLSRFTLSPSKKTPIPMEFNPSLDILAPKGGMHLKISKREKSP